ncbi:MAG: 4-alpha-glucanotransferase [Dysgonamonadaceae bacterium]|jgi:4-alpha-glucanotransferase|nr:4-alpha-glucanotransferase [Dysgonamonadaceae bacterium]
MKISFNINFHTIWGQAIYITGSIPELGNWDIERAKEMHYRDDGHWYVELELPDEPLSVEYRYVMKSDNRVIFEEWKQNHRLEIKDTLTSYYLSDCWQNIPHNMALYSSAFTQSWFGHPCNLFERVIKSGKKIILKVLAPSIKQNESLAVSGNQDELGNWNVDKVLILACDKYPEWQAEFNSENIHYPFEYKFCIVNNEDKSVIRWEKGDNRVLNVPPLKENETGIVSGLQFREEEQKWKCAGLSIPVFSLRSKNSFGIGDFNDLLKITDWVRMTRQRIIQILPINDTTMTYTYMDSYPYNSISIYALHPIYMNLEEMGSLNNKKKAQFFKTKQKELNAGAFLDYEEVVRWKWAYFREMFEQEGIRTLDSDEFVSFFQRNKEWLTPYAAYSYLRDKYQTPDFRQWEEYSVYSRTAIEHLCSPESPHYNGIALYYYLQFHAHKQLTKVRNYTRKHHIVLKGDVPIGISRTSLEAWTEPQYFNINFQAGAPPDDFAVSGQNWGFPTYHWENMEADDYNWWKKRFARMADFFDAYRIDHILGFFRIWQIPFHSIDGTLGYFNPAMPLSVDEIENSGFPFHKAMFTKANISEKHVESLFGAYSSEVKQSFLEPIRNNRFILKKEFDSQRKIDEYFSDKNSEENRFIKKGLQAICREVLFIEDAEKNNHFHPCISASNSYLYSELSHAEKYSFDSLHWDYFYHRHNEYWKQIALKHLSPLIHATNMLACGEDLGMIPQSVPEVMEKLQILSLEIERMSKNPKTEFADLSHIPYLSVCTTSTHDMNTIRGWWKENPEKTQRYCNEILKKEGMAPAEATPEICEQIIKNHLHSPSMLVIIPFQDWLSINPELRNPRTEDERINIPSDPKHYWRYRMHIDIETLMTAEELNKKISDLITQTGR